MPRVQFTDRTTFDASTMRETGDGFLVCDAKCARTGIQEYRGFELGDTRDIVRIYRPPSSVMNRKAMASLAHRTITIGHPEEMVDAKNWKKHAVGISGDEITKDGEFVRVPMVLMDVDAIATVKAGTRELSVGYYSDLEWGDGVTPEGDTYNAMQTNIRANHIAIVPQARGGPKLRLGDTVSTISGATHMERERLTKTITLDGVPFSLPEPEASVIDNAFRRLEGAQSILTADNKKLDKQLADATAELTTAKTAVQTKDGEIAVLKQQIKDNAVTPQLLNKLSAERAGIITKAKAVLGDAFKFEDLDNLAIKRAAVTKRIGDAAKDMPEAGIDGAFAMMSSTVKDDGVRQMADSFKRNPQMDLPLGDGGDAAEQAWLERGKQQRDAWKNPPAGSA